MAARVQRFYATDGDREFAVESYAHEGQQRVRLSILLGHVDHSAVGAGATEADAIEAAWTAFQGKFG